MYLALLAYARALSSFSRARWSTALHQMLSWALDVSELIDYHSIDADCDDDYDRYCLLSLWM